MLRSRPERRLTQRDVFDRLDRQAGLLRCLDQQAFGFSVLAVVEPWEDDGRDARPGPRLPQVGAHDTVLRFHIQEQGLFLSILIDECAVA